MDDFFRMKRDINHEKIAALTILHPAAEKKAKEAYFRMKTNQ